MKKQQSELFTTTRPWINKDTDRDLDSLVKRFSDGRLTKPAFQRDFVWSSEKITGWMDTVITQEAIGVIVVYQITNNKGKPDGPLYLADGLQRLTATERFLDNPNYYGYKFGPKEAKEICSAFAIPVQYRTYLNHTEAMRAFQNLNKGTALTPAEFFKGILSLDNKGKLVIDKIPNLLDRYETAICTNARSRKGDSRMHRDTYALFLQYVSKTKKTTTWDVSRSQLGKPEKSVEQAIVDYLKDFAPDEIEQKIKNFDKFISEQIAMLKEARDSELNNKQKRFSKTMLRWLLHIAIWRKNTGRPARLYRDFVIRLFQEFTGRNTITSRFSIAEEIPEEDTKLHDFTIGIGTVADRLRKLCVLFDIPLYNYDKRQSSNLDKGYHASHITPFCSVGDGKTIPEDGPSNLMRGANPVVTQGNGK